MSGIDAKRGLMVLNPNRVALSPQTESSVPGKNFGIAYGKIGTRGALEHQSQLSRDGNDFLQQWKNSPPEVLAPVKRGQSLRPLLESLGNSQGLQVHTKGK